MSKQLTLSSILAIAAMASLAVLAAADRSMPSNGAATELLPAQEASLPSL